jgi:hypothetical protein
LLDDSPYGLGLTGRERVQVADLDDVMLQRAQDGLLEFIEPIALQVVKKRDTKLLLIGSLDDSQIGLQDGLLVRLQVAKEIGLNRCGK